MGTYARTSEQIKTEDKVKRQLAQDKGITLIPIPCWWDGTKSRYLHFFQSRTHYLVTRTLSSHFLFFSLIATVRLFRPDLLNNEPNQKAGQPIPEEMPPQFMDKLIPRIEGIGEPTTATFFTRSKIDPTNWYPQLSTPLRSLITHC